MLPHWWIDAGTHESLAEARRMICGERKTDNGEANE